MDRIVTEPQPNIAQIKKMAEELGPKLRNKTFFDKFVAEPITVIDQTDSKALQGLNQTQISNVKTTIQKDENVAMLRKEFLETSASGKSFGCWGCLIGVMIILAVIIAVFSGPNAALAAALGNAIVAYYATLILAEVMTYVNSLGDLNDNSINGLTHWVCKMACP